MLYDCYIFKETNPKILESKGVGDLSAGAFLR